MKRLTLRRPIKTSMSKSLRHELDKLYAEELEKVRPLLDAARASGRITKDDLDIVVNY